jgi:signal transduction histidine kinase
VLASVRNRFHVGESVSSEHNAMQLNPEPDFADQVSPPGGDWVKREVFQRTLVLAAAAHKLKTPLAVITGYTDFLLGNNAGPLTEMQKNVLVEMQQNGVRLQRFIENFLNFSALESGRFEVKKELGDVNQCVEESFGRWKGLYAERGTGLELSLHPGLPHIAFDCLRVQHILCNLLENALKFTPAGGHVKVRTQPHKWDRRKVRGTLSFPNNRRSCDAGTFECVRIDVIDDGPGIPPEYHEEIFQEFLRIQHDPPLPGIGLGLAIARKLTEAHGGKIWVESKVNEGSTFSVLLPMVSVESR